VATDERSVHDVTLIDGLARAFYWQHLLATGAACRTYNILAGEGRKVVAVILA
jgi:uncharacterized protein